MYHPYYFYLYMEKWASVRVFLWKSIENWLFTAETLILDTIFIKNHSN